jgi:hypothetical protein
MASNTGVGPLHSPDNGPFIPQKPLFYLAFPSRSGSGLTTDQSIWTYIHVTGHRYPVRIYPPLLSPLSPAPFLTRFSTSKSNATDPVLGTA